MICNLIDLSEVVNNGLNQKEKNRVLKTDKEYILLSLHVFNAGSFVTVKCTNIYKNCVDPEYLFDANEIKNMIQFNTL